MRTKQIEKTVLINALAPTVWETLTNPNLMKKWMGEPEMEIEIITDSMSGLVDKVENYSIITFNLIPNQRQTLLTLKVDNFPTETIFKHLEFYWSGTTEIIKRNIENSEVLE